MSSNAVKYDDGFQAQASFGTDEMFKVPVQDGPKRVTYPFKNNPVPDMTCVITERDFVCRKAYDVDIISPSALNGGFETAGGGGADVFANWAESVASGTLTRDTTTFASGSASAKFVATAIIGSASLSQDVLTPGKTYKVKLWAKQNGSSPFNTVSVNTLQQQTLTTSWQEFNYTVHARPATFIPSTSTIIINIQATNTGSGTVWVDNVTVTEVDSVEAFEDAQIMGLNKSFTNKFLYSSDFTNAAWAKSNTGTGVLPVTTAGFTGPDGVLPAWRVQLDYGAGVGLSKITQNVAGLANPHAQALSFWYKSNTGASNIFTIQYLDGSSTITKLLTAKNRWQQFWITNSNVLSVNSSLTIKTESTDGSDRVVDILFAAPQLDVVSYIGPFISTSAAAVTSSLPYVDGVSTPKIFDANYVFMDYDQDSLAYIVKETDPVPTGHGNLLRFTRRFARIPGNQVIPSSKYLNRPILNNIKSGSAYACSFGDQAYSHIWTSRISVTSLGTITRGTVTKDIAASSLADLPSGNVTFVDSGSATVTVNFTSSASSLQNSLAGSLTALSNVSVTKTNSSMTVTWTGTMKSINTTVAGINISGGAGSGSITFTTNQAAATTAQTDNFNNDASVRTVNATSHGGAVGDLVVFWTGDRIYSTGIVLTVPGANSFTTLLDTLPGKDATVTHCAFSTDANYAVANGTKMCSTRNTQRFYLPGVTAGISTAADIAPPATATDPISWLAAIVAGTSWVVDSVTDLKSWDGPILMQETSEIQMSDAIDTVTP